MITPLELKLRRALKRLDLAKPITVEDIKSFVWYETNHQDLARLFYLLTEEGEIDEKHEIELLSLLQVAWNTFPHKSLNGLSPLEVSQGKSPPENVVLPKEHKKLSNLVPNRFPLKVRFIKIGKIEWGFEFPAYYHDLFERLFQLDEEKNLSADNYEEELKTILKICPETFDAANDLAEFYVYNNEPDLAKAVFDKYIFLAKSYIPEEFIYGKHRIIWGYLDNRPFLRLLASYAQFIEDSEGVSKAIPHYQQILAFNPNDNQGIRELLSTAYLKTNRLEDLIELSSHYPDDILPAVTMGNILALFKLGKIEKAKIQLKKVAEYEDHVIKELLKTEHPKPVNLMEDRVTVGGEDEAYYYWKEQGNFWLTTKGAIEFLRNNVDSSNML